MAGNTTLYNVALQIACNSTAVQRVADALSTVTSNPSDLVSSQIHEPALLYMVFCSCCRIGDPVREVVPARL